MIPVAVEGSRRDQNTLNVTEIQGSLAFFFFFNVSSLCIQHLHNSPIKQQCTE